MSPPPPTRSTVAVVPALVQAGVTAAELRVMAQGIDAKQGADLLIQKLQAERGDAILMSAAWIGGVIACAVADLLLIASIHDSVYTTTDFVGVGGLTTGVLFCWLTARNYVARSRTIMTKLLNVQPILARWSR
jgi:hypothetical protein